MLQLSFDLSSLVLASASIPALLILLVNAVGTVAGLLLYALWSLVMLPIVPVGAVGVLVWLLTSNVARGEQPKAQG